LNILPRTINDSYAYKIPTLQKKVLRKGEGLLPMAFLDMKVAALKVVAKGCRSKN
jgi:hypothetical protein